MEFEEVFSTDAEAAERERQAVDLEDISKDRSPVALSRVQLS